MSLQWSGYLVRFDELVLKGKNRREFEKRLIANIRARHLQRLHGRLLLHLPDGKRDEALENRLKRAIGISSFSPVMHVKNDMEIIKDTVLQMLTQSVSMMHGFSFGINTKRADKKFPINSIEINQYIAGVILKNFSNAKVNLTKPEIEIGIDLREEGTFIYSEKISGMRGLPVGTGARVLTLLSGGIDSPVAAWQIMKRGCPTDFIHFFSYPYTSLQSREKVVELAKVLMQFQTEAKLHVVNFASIQEAIQKRCQERFRTILYRRFMARIAERIANKTDAQALVTGENLGQVASQTLENIGVIENAVSLLILRPLLTFNKLETIKIAKEIGTYDISIQPFDDCCTLFQPKEPATKSRLEDLLREEMGLNTETLIQSAVERLETVVMSSLFQQGSTLYEDLMG